MPSKPSSPPRDDPEQSERFREAAKEAGEAAPGEFERAFKKIARKNQTPPVTRKVGERP